MVVSPTFPGLEIILSRTKNGNELLENKTKQVSSSRQPPSITETWCALGGIHEPYDQHVTLNFNLSNMNSSLTLSRQLAGQLLEVSCISVVINSGNDVYVQFLPLLKHSQITRTLPIIEDETDTLIIEVYQGFRKVSEVWDTEDTCDDDNGYQFETVTPVASYSISVRDLSKCPIYIHMTR
jgi:hypothetical protein